MQELTLTLTINEVNQILSALGKLPYSEVSELIKKIHAQANAQLQDTEKS